MKQLRLLGLALMAVVALGAVAAAAASADNSAVLLLKTESGLFEFTATGGTGTLTAGAIKGGEPSITCTSTADEGKAEATGTNIKLGVVNLKFEGCQQTKKKVKTKCNTAGDPAGTLLFSNIGFHLIDVLEGTVLQAGIALLIGLTPIKLECAAGTAIVEIKGTFDGLLLCPEAELAGKKLVVKCLEEEPKPHAEVETAILDFFFNGETCDTAGTLCAKYLKEEPPLANFSGVFEEAHEEAVATLKGNKMFFLDD
jgi:hypothetical protein